MTFGITEHLIEPSATVLVSAQGYSCLASVVVLIWDWFDTLTFEIQSIWKSPLNHQRLTYLISRYLGITFQLVNLSFTLTSGVGASYFPVPHHVCRNWLVMHMCSFFALYAIGNSNIMMQTYILHRGSSRVSIILSALVIAEYTSGSIVIKQRSGTIVFDNNCNRLNAYRGSLVFISIVVISQAVTWSLILEKVALGGAIIPIRKLLFSGGQWSWFLGAGLLAIILPIVIDVQYTQLYSFIPWPTSFISIGICRFILSSEKFRWSRQQDELSEWHPSRMERANTHSQSSTSSTSTSISPEVDTYSGNQYPSDNDDHPTINSYHSGHDVEDNHSSITSGNLADDQWSLDEGIEIGSQHTSSSLDSEEIREYWNGIYKSSSLRRL